MERAEDLILPKREIVNPYQIDFDMDFCLKRFVIY
jgi:hypothetical protein